MGKVIHIDEERIRGHLDRVVRSSVEETLNALLDAEADRLVGADRYERSEGRKDYRSGHYERKLHTKAGEVTLANLWYPQEWLFRREWLVATPVGGK